MRTINDCMNVRIVIPTTWEGSPEYKEAFNRIVPESDYPGIPRAGSRGYVIGASPRDDLFRPASMVLYEPLTQPRKNIPQEQIDAAFAYFLSEAQMVHGLSLDAIPVYAARTRPTANMKTMLAHKQIPLSASPNGLDTTCDTIVLARYNPEEIGLDVELQTVRDLVKGRLPVVFAKRVGDDIGLEDVIF